MPNISIGHYTTNYQHIGSGPLIVLLHGWANTWEAWLPIIPSLSDDYTLIIPDLPGFGASTGPESGWSTEDYAQWLEEFCLQIVRTYKENVFACIGHSFGGKIAAVFSGHKRTLAFEKLILIDASGIPIPLTFSQRILRGLSLMTPGPIKKAISPHLKAQTYKAFAGESDYAVATTAQKNTLQKILTEDITASLQQISIPTLLIWGTDDKVPPLWVGERFAQAIPHSELKTYSTGHFPHHEKPQQISVDILSFLKTI